MLETRAPGVFVAAPLRPRANGLDPSGMKKLCSHFRPILKGIGQPLLQRVNANPASEFTLRAPEGKCNEEHFFVHLDCLPKVFAETRSPKERRTPIRRSP